MFWQDDRLLSSSIKIGPRITPTISTTRRRMTAITPYYIIGPATNASSSTSGKTHGIAAEIPPDTREITVTMPLPSCKSLQVRIVKPELSLPQLAANIVPRDSIANGNDEPIIDNQDLESSVDPSSLRPRFRSFFPLSWVRVYSHSKQIMNAGFVSRSCARCTESGFSGSSMSRRATQD